ncbi:Tat pathway signal sequence domain protein [Streptomyces sp. NPDC052023]|uniref:Tat pathway signal sequence domain protein n=1 Tax=Streptomyces sp. NPDC052023 TaxID=3365681 RepID=UPI0037D2DE43
MELSGVGPVEPGEGTRTWEPAHTSSATARRLGRAARWCTGHRRALLATVSVTVLAAAGFLLHATGPEAPPPAEPPPPSQTVRFTYFGPLPGGRPVTGFRFTVTVTAHSGPPVTVTRISQPYEGLSLTAIPRPPFRIRAGDPHKIEITMRATDCGKVPRNAGLPFLDVTLRNTRAMEAHSFILGEHYAHDLSHALQVACGNKSLPLPNTRNATDKGQPVLRVSLCGQGESAAIPRFHPLSTALHYVVS